MKVTVNRLAQIGISVENIKSPLRGLNRPSGYARWHKAAIQIVLTIE